MNQFTKWTIKRPIGTVLFFVGVSLFGILSVFDLELSLLPAIEFPRLSIITILQDSTPSESDSLLSVPITEAINTVSGIKSISSESSEGVSIVTVQFDWNVSIDKKSQEIRDKIDLIRGILPDDAARPVVTNFSPTDKAVVEIAVLPGKEMKEEDLREYFKTAVKPLLDRIDGVAYVQVSGGFKKEVFIELNLDKLKAYGLRYSDIMQAVQNQNINRPAGIIKENDKEISVRINSEYKSLADIENTVVLKNILLKEVASVKSGVKERKGISSLNGKECILVSIYKEPGNNSVFISKAVLKKVNEINQKYSGKMKAEIIYNESDFIKESIYNLKNDLIIGATLSFLSLLFILKNFYSPLILLSCLPVSLCFTAFLFRMNGISLNIMSLGGLSIGIGMLFDSGNVVLTSIERYKDKGFNSVQSALRGTSEVIGSVISAVLTTIIVFLPVIFFKGILGVVFKEMALSITFSLGASLFTSITLIPVLSCIFKGRSNLNQKNSEAILKVESFYLKSLHMFIKTPSLLILITTFFFIISLGISLLIDREFFPEIEPSEILVEMLLPPGSSLEESKKISEKFQEKIKLLFPDSTITSRIGYEEEDLFSLKNGKKSVNKTDLKILFKKDGIASSKERIEILRKEITNNSNTQVFYSIPGDIFQKLLSGRSESVLLHLSGEDGKVLHSLGEEIKKGMMLINGFREVRTTLTEKVPELRVKFDSMRISDYNLSGKEIGEFLKTTIRGKIVSTMKSGDLRTDIRLKPEENKKMNQETINELFLGIQKTAYIKLYDIVNLHREDGFSSIIRTGNIKINEITANIDGIQKKEAAVTVENYIKSVRLPEGYSLDYSGDKKELDQSLEEIFFSFLLALVLIYLVLCAQFSSFLFPFIILLTVPLTLIGIFPALYLTNNSLNIAVFLGMILLLGIVVDNGALLYEYFEIMQKEQNTLQDAILESAKITLKPILLNNGTTLLGMLPSAFFSNPGSEFQSSLAITIVSGLFASVFLSLILLPVVYFYTIKGINRLKP